MTAPARPESMSAALLIRWTFTGRILCTKSKTATQEFLGRVPKRPLERRIHLLEIAVNRCDAEQIEREAEEFVGPESDRRQVAAIV